MGIARAGRRTRWATSAVLAVVFCAAGAARAGDAPEPDVDPTLRVPDVASIDLETMAEGVDASDDNWEQVEIDIPQQLEAGKMRDVLRVTRGRDSIIAFALRPKSALLLDREVLRRLRALHSHDSVAFDVLVARNRATAQLIDRLKVRDADHECASAYGHLGYQVGRMIGGDRPELEVVKAAVATLTKHEARLHVTVAEWKEIVLPALVLGRDLANEELTNWALGEVSRIVCGKEQDPEVRRLSLILDLEKGTRLAATNPAEAAPLLLRAFEALSAPGALPVSDGTLLYHYNAAVTAARLASIPIKADYRTRVVTGTLLTCEIPLGMGWAVEESSGDQDLVLRHPGGGGRGPVLIAVDTFQSNVNYTTEEGKVLDGDSMSMILKDRMRRLKPTLLKVTKESSGPGRTPKRLAPRMGWEILGQTTEGKSIRIREWALKIGRISEGFLILRMTETTPRENDPEVARVFDTLAERRASK